METWSLGRFAEFNNFLGMLAEGFGDEILTLLNKIRVRKEKEGYVYSSRKCKPESSCFEREWFRGGKERRRLGYSLK